MSYVNVLQTRIESLKARIADCRDDDERHRLWEEKADAEDELRFEWADLEAELEERS